MIQSSLIREHMEVVGSDGRHVGKVDKVTGGDIELARLDRDAGFKHHLIPVSWVDHIEEDRVFLNMTKEAAKSSWTEKH